MYQKNYYGFKIAIVAVFIIAVIVVAIVSMVNSRIPDKIYTLKVDRASEPVQEYKYRMIKDRFCRFEVPVKYLTADIPDQGVIIKMVKLSGQFQIDFDTQRANVCQNSDTLFFFIENTTAYSIDIRANKHGQVKIISQIDYHMYTDFLDMNLEKLTKNRINM